MTLWVSSASAATWHIIDLGTLPSPLNRTSSAHAINEVGVAVGSSGTSSDFKPVKFTNGGPQQIGSSGFATDINLAGDVVFNSGTGTNERGYLYSNGATTDLTTIAGASTYAWAINDAGTIVGRMGTPSGKTGFIYQNGMMTDIGGISATDVNNQGEVVGYSASGLGVEAFLYKNGVKTPLTGASAMPYAINESGIIAGQIFDPMVVDSARAAYYADGAWHSLGILGHNPDAEPFDIYSEAHDINNRNQIVGASVSTSKNKLHAFLHSNGVMYDLNAFLAPNAGWELYRAYSINDRGQIVGIGFRESGAHAFLMTPVLDTFTLDVTYANPLAVEGSDESLPAEVVARFVLAGIAGMPGMFRMEDVLSAMVQVEEGVWAEVDVTAFSMTLGAGGLTDILTLSYGLESFTTSDGRVLSLRNNSFELFIDGTHTDGQSFLYHYPDSSQTLAVVPEPSTVLLMAMVLPVLMRLRRR